MRFETNRPIETAQSTIVVDAGLAPGEHRFQLVVVDSSGNRSRPAELIVTIVARRGVSGAGADRPGSRTIADN